MDVLIPPFYPARMGLGQDGDMLYVLSSCCCRKLELDSSGTSYACTNCRMLFDATDSYCSYWLCKYFIPSGDGLARWVQSWIPDLHELEISVQF